MNSTSSSRPLDGKTAIVTGASSGIGEATAAALAGAGAKMAIVARRADRLDALAASIAGQGGSTLKFAADVANPADRERIVQGTIAEWGRLDILCNNAGVMLLSPVAEASTDEWRQMIEINLVALMSLCKLALPHLKASAGHIVNVSSVAGRIANPTASAYAATKFGVGAFSESLRREVYSDRVRVTVVEPGMVNTELGDRMSNEAARAGLEQRRTTMEGLRPEDIASAILYAVSQPQRVSINEILIRPTDQER
jgi:NADP-dependent 3-hydroxy acid dehydrogenase YdfG